ncbi:hypothetical protein DSO57_1034753 [Entomophthora muscae]|uniref:Uncharacterized protein n=1 Tax=Entomophthora muscae TaxID=34485 RepID=A0ACC2REI5_9FUNG|nr:hypothetical protein DSO57_1034753 [Entomophthora muscae]
MKIGLLGVLFFGVNCQTYQGPEPSRKLFPGEGLPLVNYTLDGKLDTSFIKLNGVSEESRQAFLDKLFDPPNFRALLVDDKLIFDTSDLMLPRNLAREIINEEIPHMKRRLRQRILNEVQKYYVGQNQEQVQANYKIMLRNITDYPGDFEVDTLNRFKDLFEAHPGLNKNFKTIVKFNRQVFNDEVLDFVSDFFTYANTTDPASAAKLKRIITSLQETYNILPRPYFARVVDAYSGLDNY